MNRAAVFEYDPANPPAFLRGVTWDKNPNGLVQHDGKFYNSYVDLLPALETCITCLKPGATKLCGRCRRERYCSEECQRKRWTEEHQKTCRSGMAVTRAQREYLRAQLGRLADVIMLRTWNADRKPLRECIERLALKGQALMLTLVEKIDGTLQQAPDEVLKKLILGGVETLHARLDSFKDSDSMACPISQARHPHPGGPIPATPPPDALLAAELELTAPNRDGQSKEFVSAHLPASFFEGMREHPERTPRALILRVVLQQLHNFAITFVVNV